MVPKCFSLVLCRSKCCFNSLTLHSVVLSCFRSFSVASRCSSVFCRFKFFKVCVEFRKFFSALSSNVIHIV